VAVRVYELAKELGLESKEVLQTLKDMGEFVRSASSTIEAPVARKLKQRVVADEPAPSAPAKAEPAKPAAAKPAAAKPAAPVEAAPVESKPAAAAVTEAPAQPKPVEEQPVAKPAAAQPPAPVEADAASAPRPSAVPKPPVPRPGGTAGLPGAGARRPGTPRPGNNPFASRQGMGVQRPRPEGAPVRPGPYGDRTPGQRTDRPPRPGGGVAGMPRPNPAMMPKTSAPGLGARPGQAGRPGAGAGRGRPGGVGAPGRGGVGGPPGGGGPGGGRGGRGGRGGSGTQGAFGRPGGPSRRGRKSKKQRRQEFDQMEAPSIGGVRIRQGDGQTVRLRRGSSLTDLAEKIGVEPATLVQVLFNLGEMVNATQSVADDTLQVLGAELNYNIEVVSPEDEDRELLESFDIEFGENEGDEDDLEARPPVVTVMGHVDHGKTKLLDALRHTDVVAGEAGGITQAIGAYQVATEVDDIPRKITFIDTPGHEAFTAMRARGARAADVPIVVAVNKIDKEGADPVKVRGQLTEYGLVPEEYGGDTMFVDVSAKASLGLDALLEAIVLTADAALDLRANPDMPAQGVAIEAHLDRGRGPVATVLVHRGTLHTGDSIVAGSAYGRVRALINDQGETVDEAPPSMPVQVLGLTSVPGAGDNFLVVEDDRMARQIAEKRESRQRAAMLAKTTRRKTLDQLFEQLAKGETQELRLILKGDSAGAVEALEDSLLQIDVGDEVSLRVIDRGVGAITETNVSLAAASDAVIIGFNVRAQGKATQMADAEGVDIRYYSVIYAAIDEVEAALKGMLKPIYEEKVMGQAEIREIFRSSKFGIIAGCMVLDGLIRRNAKARLLRDGVVVTETSIASLRREKDDVTEVREGYECGTTLAGYSDIHTGDIIETYEMVEKPRD